MSLQFVFGNSVSIKSQYIYEQIIKKSIDSKNENFIFIVPEQSTLLVRK